MSHVQVHVIDRCTLLLRAWLTTDTDASAHPAAGLCMHG
jgi:hypothetical protein